LCGCGRILGSALPAPRIVPRLVPLGPPFALCRLLPAAPLCYTPTALRSCAIGLSRYLRPGVGARAAAWRRCVLPWPELARLLPVSRHILPQSDSHDSLPVVRLQPELTFAIHGCGTGGARRQPWLRPEQSLPASHGSLDARSCALQRSTNSISQAAMKRSS
jgi:hypothetical protein